MSPPLIDPHRLRVASVPAGHPYVAHLGLGAAGIDVLPDPSPPGAPPGRWWPPVMLSADWIAEHAESFDVLHVHFAFESFSIAALSSALDALDSARRPLVFTIHDLENPQLADQRHHLAQLDVLIPRAAELITLTQGAAAEIARRWGRVSTVIPHPRMLALEPSQPNDGIDAHITPFTVGLHVRDLRPSLDGPGVTRGLAGAIDVLRADGIDARGHIVMFDDTRDPAAVAWIRAATLDHPHIITTQQPRASEAALAADLGQLHVSLLPYRHGTHSGWAELCWDLAVPVVGSPVGYVVEQHEDLGWFSACDPTEPRSLAAALRGPALQDPAGVYPRPGRARAPVIAARRELRLQQAPDLAARHRAVYLGALGRRSR